MSEIKPILQVDCEMQLGNFLLQPKCSLQSDFTALFGPSGCGKTSTLKLIAGLLQPHRGQVRLADRVLYDSESRLNKPPEKREVGLVFQDGRLFPHLSVQKICSLDCKIRRLPNRDCALTMWLMFCGYRICLSADRQHFPAAKSNASR